MLYSLRYETDLLQVKSANFKITIDCSFRSTAKLHLNMTCSYSRLWKLVSRN